MPTSSSILQKFIKPTKLALVVRSDLKMTKGKTAAQCAHAAVMCYQNAANGTAEQSAVLQRWCRMGQPKIVLRVENFEQLNGLERQAQEANVVAALVRDAGRTQLEPGTATVLGLGPAPASELDKLVAHLKLL
ncbi:GL11078 [Drosophila persimilis]|uniref:peptidyl-tRNA hydrolase n=2 Tax=pseudoobscura subgroup TaxID=32358 RepID=A0A6I8V3L8_DROPS|nr:peptidyl-tRNA hydrolase 2, mitochondrial [Drosophila persimilis]XP_002138127.1 peptidyl-tRNA hydrolase 2, mitochondrial [Drosophila pseudoobscura]EDW31318.1 GL11078 [Drosophila persimilis]